MGYLKEIIDENFIEYANYVVKDRAIPHLDDGLKPVQRRTLHAMHSMDDGRFNKVANIVGETMKYHPHGDMSIYEALVNLANKELFIEKQGNFGNITTGDRAAAARYIEARLTPLAHEVLFKKELTTYLDSYDGRNKEPLTFPARIPVLLLLGIDGIGVGMSTKILPHNFCELLEAQIKCLKDEEFTLYPDFLQGGIMDVSEYNKGNGKIKVRAKFEFDKDKKIIIREIPYSTTTESIINSIEKATRTGKVKIASINDYTTDQVEIEVNLARGYSAKEAEAALYKFTDCEVSLSLSMLCIKDNLPTIMNTKEVVKYHSYHLEKNLQNDLEYQLAQLEEKWHHRYLSQIFVEERIYKKIEEIDSYEKILDLVIRSFDDFRAELSRDVTAEDAEKLLALPIKRISRFDINKNRKELEDITLQIAEIKQNLGRIREYTIEYLEYLLKKYGEKFKRRTTIDNLEIISAKEAAIDNLKLCYDKSAGYLGTSVKADKHIMVNEFSHILIMFKDGSYKVIKVTDKLFIGNKILFFHKMDELDNDKTIFSILYQDRDKYYYLKRFAKAKIKYILDKLYRFIPEGGKLSYFTTRRNLQITCYLERLPRMRSFYKIIELEDYRIKGAMASGNKITDKAIMKFKAKKSEKYLEAETEENDLKDPNEATKELLDKKYPEEKTLFESD